MFDPQTLTPTLSEQLDLLFPEHDCDCMPVAIPADLEYNALEHLLFEPELAGALVACGESMSLPDIDHLWHPVRKGLQPRYMQGYDVRPLRRLGQSMLAQAVADLKSWDNADDVTEAMDWLNEGPAVYPFQLVAQLLGASPASMREAVATKCPKVKAVGPRSVLRRNIKAAP